MKIPDRHFNQIFDDEEIMCYIAPGDDQDMQWTFSLTDSMIWSTLPWFHAIVGHIGSQCMHVTLQARYHHPQLQMHIG